MFYQIKKYEVNVLFSRRDHNLLCQKKIDEKTTLYMRTQHSHLDDGNISCKVV